MAMGPIHIHLVANGASETSQSRGEVAEQDSLGTWKQGILQQSSTLSMALCFFSTITVHKTNHDGIAME